MPPLLEYPTFPLFLLIEALPETSSPAVTDPAAPDGGSSVAPGCWLLAAGLHLNPAREFIASRYTTLVSCSCLSRWTRGQFGKAVKRLLPWSLQSQTYLFSARVYRFPQKLLHQTSYTPFLSPMIQVSHDKESLEKPVKWRYTRALEARRSTTTNHMLHHLGQTYHRFTLELCSNTTGRERVPEFKGRMQEENTRRPGERISEHFLCFSTTARAQTVT
ncbi:unnamed protein product [Tuber melanosporum]|uniref:(Perigord truffle) hypothetical protein n=1 Tax=Tuber melanosporum (strain Mel28) TaxID=656061 RepID=D5GDC7_TUBMM|nr:uncharacterized protein GSTUM_00006150001 [Tuber melanosporum]CAZ82520.1 unnamed protein product [Tuber melanosporum]